MCVTLKWVPHEVQGYPAALCRIEHTHSHLSHTHKHKVRSQSSLLKRLEKVFVNGRDIHILTLVSIWAKCSVIQQVLGVYFLTMKSIWNYGEDYCCIFNIVVNYSANVLGRCAQML